MTAFPLTNVMRPKRNLLPLAISHGNGFWIWRILDIFIQRRRKRVSLQKLHGEPLQKHAWRGWNKHMHWLVAAVSFSGRIRATLMLSHCLSINGRESPLYSRVTTYEVFLGGYSTLKNDYLTFYICQVTCKCAKKTFPLQFCEIFFFRIAWKITSCERKNFFAIYGSFCEIDTFPLGVFSIRNFNLRNLKGNGTRLVWTNERRAFNLKWHLESAKSKYQNKSLYTALTFITQETE